MYTVWADRVPFLQIVCIRAPPLRKMSEVRLLEARIGFLAELFSIDVSIVIIRFYFVDLMRAKLNEYGSMLLCLDRSAGVQYLEPLLTTVAQRTSFIYCTTLKPVLIINPFSLT